MNKKGDLAAHFFLMICYVVGILAFLTLLSYLVTTAIAQSANTYNLEYYLVLNRMIYPKEGIFHYDEDIDRVYPGIIDSSKLDEKRLNTLFGENQDVSTRLKTSKYDVYYNKNIYDVGEYVYEIDIATYGGLIQTVPITDQQGNNDILQIGLIYQKWSEKKQQQEVII